ncbi:TPM domain-containing protein [Pelagibius sp.]|uniref:TPM domain-containing protein n=1 Tax=Pelagibius sp. TaxID=1931238 RepID=UPI003BB0B21A
MRALLASPGLRVQAIVLLLLALAFVSLPARAALDFPVLSGRVVDDANLLGAGAESRLTQLLADHESATSNQVVVVTLPSLQGTTIEEFGYQLLRQWGIGQAGRNNGALLIAAPNERKVRIEVGYGLEGELPDAIAKMIIEREILPAFRNNDFAGGITAGVNAILAAIDGSYDPLPKKIPLLERFSPVMFLFIVFAIILLIRYREEFGDGGGIGDGYHRGRSGRGYSGGGGFGGGGFGGGGFSGGGGSGGGGGGGASGGW